MQSICLDIYYIYIAFQHSFGKFSSWLGTAMSNIISCRWHWIKLKPIQQEGVCLSSPFHSFVLSFFNILQTQREWGMIYLTLPVLSKTWHWTSSDEAWSVAIHLPVIRGECSEPCDLPPSSPPLCFKLLFSGLFQFPGILQVTHSDNVKCQRMSARLAYACGIGKQS